MALSGAGAEAICSVSGLQSPYEFQARADGNGVALVEESVDSYHFQALIAKNKINSLKISNETDETETSIGGLEASAATVALTNPKTSQKISLTCAFLLVDSAPKLANNLSHGGEK